MILIDFRKLNIITLFLLYGFVSISCEDDTKSIFIRSLDHTNSRGQYFNNIYDQVTDQYFFLGADQKYGDPIFSENGKFCAFRTGNSIAIIDENGFSMRKYDEALGIFIDYVIDNYGNLYLGFIRDNFRVLRFNPYNNEYEQFYESEETFVSSLKISGDGNIITFNSSKRKSIITYSINTGEETAYFTENKVYGPYSFQSGILTLSIDGLYKSFNINSGEVKNLEENNSFFNNDDILVNRILGEHNVDIFLKRPEYEEKRLTLTPKLLDNSKWINRSLIDHIRNFLVSRIEDSFTLKPRYFGKTFKEEDAIFFYDSNTSLYFNENEKSIEILPAENAEYMILDDNEKKLLLISDILFNIYNDDGSIYFRGTSIRGNRNDFVDLHFKTSSFLTEGNVVYGSGNLGVMELDNPWVENADGYGIGETINISSSDNSFSELIISNGYVSFEKPYLYNKNGRLKRIKVTDIDGNFTLFVDLLDSSNPQSFCLPFDSNEITIEILEVYPGSTWEDTCVNFIVGK